jgi:hypothetical protein
MVNKNPFTGKAWYHPERDGTLEDYLKIHNGLSSFPLFSGYSQYKMLWDQGYLEPNSSYIRLMWNLGRYDEHFLVIGEDAIQGISDIPAHAGRPGVYDPRKLFSKKNCPAWEAQCLNRNPKPRV